MCWKVILKVLDVTYYVLRLARPALQQHAQKCSQCKYIAFTIACQYCISLYSPLPCHLLTPLFLLPHIRLCLRALTESRWLGKHVKNLSPVNTTFEAPPHPLPSATFFPSPLKFIIKLFLQKYPVNSIKVIFSPLFL